MFDLHHHSVAGRARRDGRRHSRAHRHRVHDHRVPAVVACAQVLPAALATRRNVAIADRASSPRYRHAYVAFVDSDAADRLTADAAARRRLPVLAAIVTRHDRRIAGAAEDQRRRAGCELRLARDAADRASACTPKPSCAASVFRRPRAGSFGFVRVSPTNGCPTAARSSGSIRRTAASSHVVNAQSLPLATKAFNLVYPIHASTVGGFIYKAAMTAAGLALTLLGTLAVYGFWRHRVNAIGRPPCHPSSAPSRSQLTRDTGS